MANLTQTSMADGIKTMYEKRLLVRALARLVHGRFATRARINGFGAYEVRKYGALSAVTTPISVEGTTPSEQSAPTITTVTMTPLFYGSWLAYTDEMDLTKFDPILSETSGILGEQCGLSADTIVRDTVITAATVDYAADKAARTALDSPHDDISYADYVKQMGALEAASALPPNGVRFPVVMHAHTWTTLMQDPVFVQMFIRADDGDVIRTGRVGSLLNTDIYISANAKETADGGVSNDDVYHTLFIGANSFAMAGFANTLPNDVDSGGPGGGPLTGRQLKPVEIIAKPLGSAGAADPLNQRGSLAWKMTLDVKALNSDWIRSLEHTTVFSAD